MNNKTVSQEILQLLRENYSRYKAWIKPDPADPLFLSIVKTFFKGLTAILLLALSPVVILLLTIAFVAAF